jgi:hypothetical protein
MTPRRPGFFQLFACGALSCGDEILMARRAVKFSSSVDRALIDCARTMSVLKELALHWPRYYEERAPKKELLRSPSWF